MDVITFKIPPQSLLQRKFKLCLPQPLQQQNQLQPSQLPSRQQHLPQPPPEKPLNGYIAKDDNSYNEHCVYVNRNISRRMHDSTTGRGPRLFSMSRTVLWTL